LADQTVRCWGLNAYGQLGQGTFTTTGTEGIPTPVPVTLGKPAQAIATSGLTTYALLSDGTVWGWGRNYYGELGQGTFTTTSTSAGNQGIATSVKVMGLPGAASSIVSGYSHACAIVSGAAYCWGFDESGQLGDGNFMSSLPNGVATAVQAQGLGTVTALAAGSGHTCALTSGNLKCWGDNSYGEIGTGVFSPTTYATPQFVNLTNAPAFVAIAAASRESCLVFSGGAVYCWGANDSGQLGNGSFTSSSPFGVATAAPIASASGGPVAATAVSVGDGHACALTTGGSIYCWGGNGSGELGNGTFTSAAPHGIATPALVTGLSSPASAISAGGFHTCALLHNGSVWCWGDDTSGALGNNASANSPTPVQVVGW
jgi:alpha-tubulin suppressor-like RCC1 family protein